MAFLRSRWTSNISNDLHTSSYVSKILHVKFQALQVKFPQTVAQMVEKSVVLDKKSTVVNIQSNFIIFGQHQYFEVIFIIWSRVDHDSSRKVKIWSKVKVSKLGFFRQKSSELWQSITFRYFIRNSITTHFEENSILYNFMSHKLGQKMLHLEVMSQNITSHFKSQQKVIFLQRSVHEHGNFNEDETKRAA